MNTTPPPPAAPYRGRFAPSPTGPLHFGSLTTALASFLEAKRQHGQWRVRIEDVDTTRCQPQFSAEILRTLDAHQLHWDGEVCYQSQRSEVYQHALNQLIAQQAAFPCACSRTQLADQPHHGLCPTPNTSDFAWRFLCPDTWQGAEWICFEDALQGRVCLHLHKDLDDFVLKRRDGLWAYQLAVVCDDIAQGITHIVRGLDIIDSTARQALLYAALQEKSVPQYAHLPLVRNDLGQKLSKQNHARAIDDRQAAQNLFDALVWLKQNPPRALRGSVAELLDWAITHWDISALKAV